MASQLHVCDADCWVIAGLELEDTLVPYPLVDRPGFGVGFAEAQGPHYSQPPRLGTENELDMTKGTISVPVQLPFPLWRGHMRSCW